MDVGHTLEVRHDSLGYRVRLEQTNNRHFRDLKDSLLLPIVLEDTQHFRNKCTECPKGKHRAPNMSANSRPRPEALWGPTRPCSHSHTVLALQLSGWLYSRTFAHA